MKTIKTIKPIKKIAAILADVLLVKDGSTDVYADVLFPDF